MGQCYIERPIEGPIDCPIEVPIGVLVEILVEIPIEILVEILVEVRGSVNTEELSRRVLEFLQSGRGLGCPLTRKFLES
ncbi:MAG: hypothetical protein VXV86_03890 [Verrucomicrobiota bacterium]|nr:hypothetical protein [Verrucomicrobiota bacterium]